MKVISIVALTLGALVVSQVSACSSWPLEGDARIGEAVVAVRQDQTLHRGPRKEPSPPVLLAGSAAKASMDRYQKSFEAPPPPVYGLNFGVISPAGHAPTK